MAVLYKFEVFTPYRLFFAGLAEIVTMTLADGKVGIMAHHSPFIAPVETGVLRIKTEDSQWRCAFIGCGILEVTEKKTVLLTDTAEWPEEINTERAITQGNLARENLETAMFKFEIIQAKKELQRSEYRLKVAGMKG